MKRFAIIVAVIVAVLAIAVAAAPFVVPSDFVKQRVADRIAELTGRVVSFSGDTSISIYPYVSVTVDGLSIANPTDMGTDPFITADSLHTRLRFLPLLLGRAEFEEFELVKPTIHLIVDNNGRTNWNLADSPLAKRALAPPPAAGGPARAHPDEIKIGRLLVDNGTVLYDNLGSNTREEFSEVDLDVTWPSVTATASGRGKLRWRGEVMEFTGLLAAPMQLFSGKASPARFAIASTPLRASFSGRASDGDGFDLDGDASVSTPSMRRTIEWLGTPMGTGPILGAASVRGTVGIFGSRIDFTAASIELDGNTAQGSLGVRLGGARPAISGALALDSLDLSAYIEAIRADLTAEGLWLVAPARVPFVDAIDADLRLSAGAVMMGGARIGKTAATIGIKDGTLDIEVAEADLYSGTLSARLAIGQAGKVLAAAAQAKFSSVPAQLVLTDLAGIGALEGATTLNFDLTARGRSWSEFANAVAGSGALDISDGRLVGIDLPAIAETLADPFATPVAGGSGATKFAHLTADLSVANGEISTSNLAMSSEDFSLSLGGHGSVLNGSVDGTATLTSGMDSIPVTVAGTWRQLVIARMSPPPVPGGAGGG